MPQPVDDVLTELVSLSHTHTNTYLYILSIAAIYYETFNSKGKKKQRALLAADLISSLLDIYPITEADWNHRN